MTHPIPRRAATAAYGLLCGILALGAASRATLIAQDIEPPASVQLQSWLDSGAVANTSTDPALQNTAIPVWSQIVTAAGHSSMRLHYEGVVLAGDQAPGGRGSFLRITSLLDGAPQLQHTVHVSQWNNTSAYFNGDAVLVEILAYPGTGPNRFVLREIEAGVPPVGVDSICGPTDDRVASFDQRQGRNQPGGCTSWLIDDCEHCFLTAGHCSGSLQVVQFNVPNSSSGGSINHPSPSDQYAVDASSLQSNGGQGIGNDYAYFGVFPNSNTGLTPFQANGGQTYALAATPPAVSGQQIRITGYGSSSTVPTLNLVQKTHVGPYYSFSGTTIRYTTDTTGGNSGSPVIIDGTNTAIGIHTHAGCDPANHGTGINLPALQAVLANPLGVCRPRTLAFSIQGATPRLVAPDGTTTIRLQVSADGANTPVSNTGQLHYDTGAGFAVVPMAEISPNLYEINFPATACGTGVDYYFTAQASNGTRYPFPFDAPAEPLTAIYGVTTASVFSYDFNTAVPWTTTNVGLTDGAWERADPVGNNGSRRDPVNDFDGSGFCWVTGNGNNADVDDGPTILITEVFDLSAATDPIVAYARWFKNDDGDDSWVTSISSNGGSSWTVIDSVMGDQPGWESVQFRIRDYATNLSQIRFRFSVGDVPNNSVTEGALDAFEILDIVCSGSAASWQSTGSGCAGSLATPNLIASTLPVSGATMSSITTGVPASGQVFGVVGFGAPTPVDLSVIGMTGCSLYPTTIELTMTLTNLGGVATWALPVPLDANLNGVVFVQQVIAVDPGANALGLITSNGGVGTIGF